MELNNDKNSTRKPKPDFENTEHEKKSEQNQEELVQSFFDEIDSTCSTPYVSAPSSPGRGSGSVNGGFYYSAPASPMHFALMASYPVLSSSSPDNGNGSGSGSGALGFEFGSGSGAMSSADELFLDGKIRPMKLSNHLERPQVLAPLLDLDEQEEGEEEKEEIGEEKSSNRGRDLRVVRDKSMRRRTRSLSPLRSSSLKWDDESVAVMLDDDVEQKHKSAYSVDHNNNNKDMEEKNGNSKNEETTTAAAAAAASLSASSSRSSSAGRSSKRWVFLKDFLYRSKSEGRSNNKFWSTISFSPVHKEKKPTSSNPSNITSDSNNNNNSQKGKGIPAQVKKPVNGIGKRRVPPSPHELHYTANRAQAEEMRKKTFLPYRQGLLGCLGFSSKGYGAMSGLARALNPVSSR